MSLLQSIFKQSFFYLGGEIAIIASGLISFPIFTRILSKEAYGIMSLIGVTLFLAETVFSGGLRHAMQRFYGELKKKQQDSTLLIIATTFYGSLLLSAVGIIILVFIVFFLIIYISHLNNTTCCGVEVTYYLHLV